MIALNRPWNRIWIQSVFWIVITFFLAWLPILNRMTPGSWFAGTLALTVQVVLIAVNVTYLFPKLFLQDKQLTYFLILGGVIVITSFILMPRPPGGPPLQEMRPIRPVGGRHPMVHPTAIMRFGVTAFPLLVSIFVSILLEVWEFTQQKMRENTRLANEKLKTELQFLKSQINPHFLFNALNNIYSLSILQSEKTPESIAQLSDMLRYVLYDCEKDWVPLQKELDYIRDYIQLFQLKKTEGLNIQLDLPENSPDLTVPPMLFIPFIENALKHSHIEDIEHNWVNIQMELKDRDLFFWVTNSIPAQTIQKDLIGGIGLENVKRRLSILYPNRHDLSIQSTPDEYSVQLILHLNQPLQPALLEQKENFS